MFKYKSTKENYQGIISNIEFRGNLLRVEIKDIKWKFHNKWCFYKRVG